MKAEDPESHRQTFRFCSEYIRKSSEALEPESDNSFISTYKRSLTGTDYRGWWWRSRKTSWEARS